MSVSSATRARAGETVCGDATSWHRQAGRIVLALADGLGHGAEAAAAAQAALDCIARHPGLDCERLFSLCDRALRSSRGAALAIVIIDERSGLAQLASVGNVRVRLIGTSRRLSFGGARGIIGAGYRNLAPESVILQAGDMLVLFSDGIDELADISLVLNARAFDVAHTAPRLLAAFARADDDASMLVYCHSPQAALGVQSAAEVMGGANE